MSLIDVLMNGLHLGFAGLWVGSVIFVTVAILPAAREGSFDAAPLEALTERFKWLSRTSVLLLLVSGGHLAGTRYTAESLFGTGRGHLVLAMAGLWSVLAALVEIGAKRLSKGFAERKVRMPAREARPYFLAGSAVGAALFAIGALLSTGALA